MSNWTHEMIEKAEASLQNDLPFITEPPCKDCKHFTPKAKTTGNGFFSGISLCSAKTMHADFSCHEARKG